VRVFLILLLAATVACAQSPEPTTAKRTVVMIPHTKPQNSRKSKSTDAEAEAEAEDIPASQREMAREAPEGYVEEEAPAEEDPNPGFFPSAAGGPTGGPDCDAVADCCLKLMTVMGSVTADPRICEQFRNAPSAVCPATLQQLQVHAVRAGVRCGP